MGKLEAALSRRRCLLEKKDEGRDAV